MPLRFQLKKPTGTTPTIIVCTLCEFGFRIRKNLKLKVVPWMWDKKRMRIKPTSLNHLKINEYLAGLESKVDQLKLDYITQFKKPSPDEFMNRIFETPKENVSIWDQFDDFVSHEKTRSGVKETKAFFSAFNNFKVFDPALRTITSNDLDRFGQWLLKKDHSPNYCIKIVSFIQRYASWLGLDATPTQKIKPSKTDTIALSLSELSKIAEAKMPTKSLDQIRDLFLFSCYTGLRYSDLIQFNRDMVQSISGVLCINLFSKKTGQKSVIPLLDDAGKILLKYNNNLPPRISGQKFNDYIKEVCRLSGIDSVIQVQKSKGTKKEVVKFKKHDAVSSHTARRSFVSNMSSLGLTAKEISLMTGHTQMRIVDLYDKTKAEDNAVRIFNRLNQN